MTTKFELQLGGTGGKVLEFDNLQALSQTAATLRSVPWYQKANNEDGHGTSRWKIKDNAIAKRVVAMNRVRFIYAIERVS